MSNYNDTLVTPVTQILVIDGSLPDTESFLAGLDENTHVVWLDSAQDGVAQITTALENYSDLSALQIISHGDSGSLSLGNARLDSHSLTEDYRAQLSQWSDSFTENADILLYGCNVAEGEEGHAFISQVASLTGADVAASNDLTGSAVQGGDWQLEEVTGEIDVQPLSFDTYSYLLADGHIISDGGSGGGGGGSTGTAIHNIGGAGGRGSSQNGSLTGTAGNDLIFGDGHGGGGGGSARSGKYGGAGVGGGGNDQLAGGSGDDILFGDGYHGSASPGTTGGSGGFLNGLGGGSGGNTTSAGTAGYDSTTGGGGGAAGSAYGQTGGTGGSALIDNVDTGGTQWTAVKNVIDTNLASLLVTTTGIGADTLDGGAGNDHLFGMGGDDIYVFDINDAGASDTDIIYGWGYGTDKIELKNNGVTLNSTQVAQVLLSQTDDSGDRIFVYSDAGKQVTVRLKDKAGTTLTTANFVEPVNFAPVLSNQDTDTVTYIEGAAAAVLYLGTALTLTDSDSTDFDGGNLTATISAGKDAAEDILALSTTGTVSVAGATAGSNVSVGGTVIGTLGNNIAAGNDLVVNFNASATPANVATLTQALTYANSDTSAPSTAARTIQVTVNDGDGGTSTAASVTVNVTDVNDEPTLTATGSSPSFVEGGSAVGLFSASAASSVESGQTFTEVKVTVTNVSDGAGANEFLAIDGENIALNSHSGTTASNGIGFAVVLTAGTATITLTKAGMSAVNVQTLIDNLAYSNTSATPSNNDRVVTLTSLQDGGGTANSGDDTNASLSIASTVSIQSKPQVTSATYDASSNQLVVTGTGFVANSGVNNDVDVSTLTLTGEAGASYTLTSSSDVEIDSATQFTITLSGADLQNVESLINKDGTASESGTTYNLAAADDFLTGVTSADTADATNGLTLSNYAVPTITSATYDAATGVLVVTGTEFVNKAGATNDVDASLLSLIGEGAGSYTLTDTSDVEVTSATSFTVTLSATDKLNINGLLNKDGTSADDSTTYNLAAAEDWMVGAPAANNIVDATGNGVIVNNVVTPTITSATYDSDSGLLSVTGTNFVKKDGAENDVDVSTLTLTGGTGDATYTLTSATDVEIISGTAFSVTLSGSDKTGVDALLDQIGTSSSGGSTYNLAVADNWMAGAAASTDIADATGNAVTVAINPGVTSATYDASTGALVVTGTNIQANGGGSDIDASLFTLTGEGGATYTLTDTSDVNRDSATQFTLTLSATDNAEVNQILNSDGTSSTGGTTFNLAVADDWNTNVTAGDSADTTGNGVTVSNVVAPTITSSSYDATAGSLVVTGTGLLKRDGATNDIDVSTLTFTGEGGETYTLTDSTDVEITSGTEFTVSLSATDKAAINQIVNKDGTSSTSATTYNLAAAEDWANGAAAAVDVVDLTGNGITVSNVAAPTITSATYTTAGTLVVTGTGLLKKDGATNDIDVSLLTLTGEAGATYTLTDSADVELTSGSEFTVTLSSTDKTAVNALLNKAGTSSTDSTTYNLAAAEDWAAGADATVNVVDTTGNGITVTIPPAPTPAPSTPAPTTETVDGVDVKTSTKTNSDGSTTKTQTIAPVTDTRKEDSGTSNSGLADIPVLQGAGKPTADLTVALPVGIGLESTGSSTPTATSGAKDTLLALIDETVPQSQETDRQDMRSGGSSFLDKVADENLWVNKLTLTSASGANGSADTPVQINGQTTGSNGSAGNGAQQVALVIDASALPSGTVLQLNDVSFAVIVGPATLTGGEGANIIYAGTGSQHIVLGADDDELHGGDGDDTVGSKGGDDLIFGENGNDTLFGGAGADTLHGGADSDTVTYDGAMADYNVTQVNGVVTVALKTDASDSDTVINVETLQFSDQSFNPATSTQQEAVATLYQQVLGRQADVTGFQWWAKDIDNGYGLGDVALAFMRSDEYQTKTGGTAFDNLSVDQQVEALYTAVLGRASDAEGKAYWVAETDAGFSIEQMAEAFVTSTELTGQYLQSTQWDFIL